MKNHNDVTSREIVDRLRAIGPLAERVDERSVDPEDALITAAELLHAAFAHLDN